MRSGCRFFAMVFIALAGCRAPVEKRDTVPVVRIATVLGRITNPLAEALNKVLPDHFPARVEVQKTDLTGDYVRLIAEGNAELAMIQTDVAYAAYTQSTGDSPSPRRRLRGVAVLYTTPLHLIALQSSRIRNLMDLRGKRVVVVTIGSPTEFTARMTLEGVGLSVADVHPRQMPLEEAIRALRAGEVDAVFGRGNDPSPSIRQIMSVPGMTFIPIGRGQIDKIRAYHPFLHSTSIPAGIYGNHPEIETVGVEMLLACRDDLPVDLVYWITRTLFESLPVLADSFPPLRQIDLEHVQASPIPLHSGAARFYRERELFQ
ncbi:MAG: hypothetical protein DMG11_31915 [Acidobacteria bacterium]|nr:MAG: hypothetical protein DMG11_31915 [Acidobacteriota bacterium]